MKKLKESLKSLIHNRNLWLCLIIVLLFFVSFIKVDFSRCTYRMFVNPYEVEFEHFLSIGRYLVAIWWKIVSCLGLNLTWTYRVSFFMSILFFTLALYKKCVRYLGNWFLIK